MSDNADRTDGLWVISDLVNGEYVTVVTVDGDLAIPLTLARAIQYATTVIQAGEYARYDAAVVAQIVDLDEKITSSGRPGKIDPLYLAGDVISALRKARDPLTDAYTAPLRFEPIVASKTRLPEVNVFHGDRQVAALSTWAANQHASFVLQVALGIDLDRIYRNQLANRLHLGHDIAQRMVHALAGFRDPAWDQPDPDEGIGMHT